MYQHVTIFAMELIGDLGDIKKVTAMLHELLDGATVKVLPPEQMGGWCSFQLVLKPLAPPK